MDTSSDKVGRSRHFEGSGIVWSGIWGWYGDGCEDTVFWDV